MSRRPRRNHSPAFKAKVVAVALGYDMTIADIAHKHDMHSSQVTDWTCQLLERAAAVFGAIADLGQPAVDLNALRATIGPLTLLENEFFGGALTKAGFLSPER
jgi:transposase